MAINYLQLSSLLNSSLASEASRALINRAHELGIADVVRDALEETRAGLGTTEAPNVIPLWNTEDIVQKAFLRLEAISNRSGSVGGSKFGSFANALSELALRVGETREMGKCLLEMTAGDGRPMITNRFVRDHVECVLRELEDIGTAYLAEPILLRRRILLAFEDLRQLKTIVEKARDGRGRPSHYAYSSLVQEADRTLSVSFVRESREDQFKRVSDINRRLHQLLQRRNYEELLQWLLLFWICALDVIRSPHAPSR